MHKEKSVISDISKNMEMLKRVLASYRSIRKENDLQINDLISKVSNQDQALKTNLKLLEDAALYTKDLDDKEEIVIHRRAKEVLLFWCIIYCEKVLLKRYSSKRAESVDAVLYGAKNGVMYQYERIRQALCDYFKLPESERGSIYKELKWTSVKAMMLDMATKRTKTEFNRQKGLIEVEISKTQLQVGPDINKLIEDEEEKLKKDSSTRNKIKLKDAVIRELIDENKKKDIFTIIKKNKGLYTSYICDVKVIDKIKEDYAQKGINVFEGKYGNLYYNRYISDTFTNGETGEPFDNPDALGNIVDTIESEAQELMDKYTIVQEMRKVIAYMVQSGEIDVLEEEFIWDVICGDVKAADKEREWMNKGINISQTIGNYQRSILSKMQKVMSRKKEWAELAKLVPRRKK